MEEVLIICFNAYGHYHEKEFDGNVRMKRVHQELSEVCESYIITQVYITHKPIK
jgi:hypothetical protein